ncbi:MAG: IscS subfamily cysteine desulfurase [Armatimonadetes bacterium]|nr:IscS subfamily cysteine desulfurase [Armatimonadota bacterium]
MIYLDNNATTKPDPRVVEAMLPSLREAYGNAASRSHPFGWAAEEAVETARGRVAALIGADPREIVWTSGATESDNLALKGVAEAYADRGDHLVTAATEHKAVLDAARHLERQGKRVTILPVDKFGVVDLDALRDSLTERTVLVSVMLANNEVGTLAPLAEISRLCREHGILFHTDATQGVGKVPVDVEALGVDLMSFTAHKMYGPKGVGALYVRRRNPRVRLTAQMDGGGHERGMRSGTLNVPGIVGFGAAAELCRQEMARDAAHTCRLRDRLHEGIQSGLDGVALNGHPTERLPNTLNLRFEDVEADALLLGMPQVALSSGSACTSASVEPSHVLRALGLTDAQARSSLRFSLGRFTTEEEIDRVAERVVHEAARLRRLAPERVLTA